MTRNGTMRNISINTLKYVVLYRFVSGKFQAFDFGATDNRIHYNQTSPPEFDVSLITSPIAVYYGENDIFVGKKVTHPDIIALLR